LISSRFVAELGEKSGEGEKRIERQRDKERLTWIHKPKYEERYFASDNDRL
jgi:hypothetical protein